MKLAVEANGNCGTEWQHGATTGPIELLTPSELEAARETRFLDGSYDEWQRLTREKVLTFAGLVRVYQREPMVNHSLRFYLAGQYTLQGALLLAHRALVGKHASVAVFAGEYGVHGPWQEFERLTIEDVRASHVIGLANRVEKLMRRASAAMSWESPQRFAARINRDLGLNFVARALP